MKLLLTFLLFISFSSTVQAKDDNVYDRVMKRGKIQCGYFIEPPFTMKDENTGEMSGLSVELAELIASDLNLELEWKEEINFATFQQDLNNKRYDMVCGSIFILPRGGLMTYSKPYAFVSMEGYVRPDNTSFDKDFDEVDWSNVTIAGLDGEGATTAAQKLLPEATMNILPQLSSISEMLLVVANKKADIGFVLPSVFDNFNQTNPGVLRKAKLSKPLYSYAVTFGLPRGEDEFKALIDNALTQYIVSGELAAIFKKYDPKDHFDYPVISKE